MKHIIHHITLLVATALLAVACSADDATENRPDGPDADGYGRIQISLALPEGAAKTRALTAAWDDEWTDLNVAERTVYSYHLLVCENGNILETFDGTNIAWGGHDDTGKYHTSSTAFTTTNPISAGNHNLVFYCLANFTADMMTEAGLPLDAESKISTTTLLTDFETKAVTIAGANSTTMPATGIPMTGKLEKTVNIGGGTTTIADPLILWRAMAKVEFQFFSAASKDVTVKRIKLNNITSAGSQVYLLSTTAMNQTLTTEGQVTTLNPDRSSYGNGDVISFPQGTNGNAGTNNNGYAAVSVAYAPAAVSNENPDGTLPVTAGLVQGSAVPALPSYINESVADAYNQHFTFTLTTERESDNGSLVTQDENYHLTDLAYILRNDHVIIPVCFTDYIFRPRFALYPPIGGYPDAEITETDNAFYYVVTPSDDEFVIQPNLYKSTNNARIPVANNPNLNNANEVNWSCDNTSIFDSGDLPHYMEDSGASAIKGTFNKTEGTATFTFTFSDGKVTLSRTLVITVKAKS